MNELWHAILEVWYGWHGEHWDVQTRHRVAAIVIPVFGACVFLLLWAAALFSTH